MFAGKWKQRNLGETLRDLQLRKNARSNSDFRVLIESFSDLRRSEMLTRPLYLAAKSKMIDLKGLDSSNNIDSRINITTFFNFPEMFRRYIGHLQCYIF